MPGPPGVLKADKGGGPGGGPGGGVRKSSVCGLPGGRSHGLLPGCGVRGGGGTGRVSSGDCKMRDDSSGGAPGASSGGGGGGNSASASAKGDVMGGGGGGKARKAPGGGW